MIVKNRRKIQIALSLTYFLFVAIFIPIASTFNMSAIKQRIYDQAGLLEAQQEQSLQQRAQQLSDQLDMDIIIATTNNAQGKSAMQYADDLYDQNNFGVGEDARGALFLIDMDNREAWISTSGIAVDYLTDDRIQKILDQAYAGLSAGDYHYASEAFLDKSEQYVLEGIEQNQHRYDTQTGETYYNEDAQKIKEKGISGTDLAVSSLGAVTAGAASTFGISSKYKLKSNTYKYSVPDQNSFNLREPHDAFLKESVTSRIIPRVNMGGPPRGGSTGSGRSSTHTSSSGRTHGGGGRKF